MTGFFCKILLKVNKHSLKESIIYNYIQSVAEKTKMCVKLLIYPLSLYIFRYRYRYRYDMHDANDVCSDVSQNPLDKATSATQ